MHSEDKPEDEVVGIMGSLGIEREEAEEVRDIMDELGVDEDDANEILEAGGI